MNKEDRISLVKDHKIEMIDLDIEDPNLSGYDILQPKYDGWWTIVIVLDNKAEIITSGGELRSTINIKADNAVLLCEWMYGTNWSQNPAYKGKLFVFDIVELNGYNLRSLPYFGRYQKINDWIRSIEHSDARFIRVESYDTDHWKDLWESLVVNQGYEGIVLKKADSYFSVNMHQARMKRIFTKDYVVMGFKEGTNRLEGTLGALEVGLFRDNTLERICSVGGGFTDSLRDIIWNNKVNYLYKVVEVSGKALFESGALRHPAFKRFRTDKLPSECKL